MKKWLLNISVCCVGLVLVIGCGGGDGDGDGGGGSANLDAETEEIMEVLQQISGGLGSFVSPAGLAGKRLAAMAFSQPLDRAFSNEPVIIPGATSGSAVRNGNLSGTVSATASPEDATVTFSGNYLTMITFSALTLESGGTVNGRLSDGGTFSGNVHVGMNDAGTGSLEFTDTIQSQPDFTVNGSSVSVLLDTVVTATYVNGNLTMSGRQTGIINGQSVNRTF